MADENTKIKVWYHDTFPDDDLYTEIKADFRFYDLFLAWYQNKNIYQEMFIDNGGNTIILERCFSKLAEIMGVDYDYIYYQWLA